MNWMVLPLKRYAEFRGRSRRLEFWMFTLFTIIASVLIGLVDSALGLTIGGVGPAGLGGTGALGSIFSLATLVPSIAVAVRRLHDTDRSGWWLLMPVVVGIAGVVAGLAVIGTGGGIAGLGLAFLPLIIGALVLLVFYCLEGTRGTNRFGADPKDPAGHADLSEVFG